MPTNLPIATVTSGTVGSSAWADSVANLNQCVGLLDVGVAYAGASPPPTTAPNFQFEAGAVPVTFSAGVGTLTYPTTFTNGVLLCLVQQANPGLITTGTYSLGVYSSTHAAATLNFVRAGVTASGAFTINFFAIGW